ncbi:MAG: GerMN domain-containing protein [Clostridiaceae bacterium]|nr:GerMN domain-containing protein [Eubacteriales bacterium]
MRSRFIYLVVCMLLLCSLFAGCKRDAQVVYEDGLSSEAGYRRTVLYYLSDEGFVVPVMKLIPWEEGIGKAALSYLVDQNGNRESASALGLNTVLPAGTAYTLRIGDDKCAALDLIGLSDLGSAAREEAMVTSVVNTLAEFGSIDTVRITLDGKSVKALPHGTKISGEMGPFPLNMEQPEAQVITDSAYALTLYFPNTSGSLNVPVTRLTNIAPTLESAVRELLKGPKFAGLLNAFPEGTEMLGISYADGAAVVNLSDDFKQVELIDGLAQAAYDSLYLTLAGVQPISILEVNVSGQPYDALAEETTAPLYANEYGG